MDNVNQITMTPAEGAFLGLSGSDCRVPEDEGNNRLYGFCGTLWGGLADDSGSNFGKNPGLLADQMWLIGRSYAASPERARGLKHEDKDLCKKQEEFEDKHLDLGYQSFFGDIANALCGDGRHGTPLWKEEDATASVVDRRTFDMDATDLTGRFKKIKAAVSELDITGYEYDSSLIGFENGALGISGNFKDGDGLRLAKSICCVAALNLLLRDARYLRTLANERHFAVNSQFDEAGKQLAKHAFEEQNFSWSFCSKLLHFHAPERVFIIDSIAEYKVRRLFNGRCPAAYHPAGSPISSKDKGIIDILAEQLCDLTKNQKEIKKLDADSEENPLLKKLASDFKISKKTINQCVPCKVAINSEKVWEKFKGKVSSYAIFCLREYYIAWLIHHAGYNEGFIIPYAPFTDSFSGKVMAIPPLFEIRLADLLASNVQIRENPDNPKEQVLTLPAQFYL